MTKTYILPGTHRDDLHRLSACMLGELDPASLAHEAVIRMEMGLLRQGWPVGQLLGALPDVRKRFGLGRPAFREAITIMESRGLLDVRRGPGGGLFVAAPALDDVVGAVLMYLALAGGRHACVEEFRLLVWRMVVATAVQHQVVPIANSSEASEWGFAVELAEQCGNTLMVLLARLAEMLVRTAIASEPVSLDAGLSAAIKDGDLSKAFQLLEDVTMPTIQETPIIAFDVAERAFSLSGRKSAIALAARMTRELSDNPGAQEAEWETADRLGYTDAVVRQARRILQDFGIVRCRQGRKGAELAPTAVPGGVIRLLAPCLMANATTRQDYSEAISLLVSGAPVLAARRRKSGVNPFIARCGTSANTDAFPELTVENRLLELTGNPLLEIVVRSLGVASLFIAADTTPPMESGEVVAINRLILAAIDVGDVGAADILARNKLNVMQRHVVSQREVA